MGLSRAFLALLFAVIGALQIRLYPSPLGIDIPSQIFLMIPFKKRENADV